MFISNRKIGENEPIFVVAELSANHNQDLETALKLVKKSAELGADAVKLQTYTPDTITLNSDKEFLKLIMEQYGMVKPYILCIKKLYSLGMA